MMQRAVKLRGLTDDNKGVGMKWSPREEAPRQKEIGIGQVELLGDLSGLRACEISPTRTSAKPYRWNLRVAVVGLRLVRCWPGPHCSLLQLAVCVLWDIYSTGSSAVGSGLRSGWLPYEGDDPEKEGRNE